MANLIALVCFACGIVAAVPIDQRLIGGKDAPDGMFPYVVSLRDAEDEHMGTGTIISDSWILSVAQTVVLINCTHLVAGTTSLSSGGTRYNVSQTILNPNYDLFDFHDDIALLQIDGKLTLGPNVKPVELPSAPPANNTAVTIAGWGVTKQNDKTPPDHMQYLDVAVIDNKGCRGVTNTSICTIGPVGKGICTGDNGDPVVADNVVYGMAAWAVPCAKGKPDGHTNVALFNDWIKKTTGL